MPMWNRRSTSRSNGWWFNSRALCKRTSWRVFGKNTINLNPDPDKVVALGAAIQADILVGE